MGDQNGDEAEIEATVRPLVGVPWSIEFSYLEDSDGVVWVEMQIDTIMGTLHFTCPPDFAESMANKWHTMAVKAKHHISSPTIEVPQVDMSKIVDELRKE